MRIKWFETDDEIVKNKYLQKQDMEEAQILELGF